MNGTTRRPVIRHRSKNLCLPRDCRRCPAMQIAAPDLRGSNRRRSSVAAPPESVEAIERKRAILLAEDGITVARRVLPLDRIAPALMRLTGDAAARRDSARRSGAPR